MVVRIRAGCGVMMRGGCTSARWWLRRELRQKEIRANYVKPTLEMLYYTYLYIYHFILFTGRVSEKILSRGRERERERENMGKKSGKHFVWRPHG